MITYFQDSPQGSDKKDTELRYKIQDDREEIVQNESMYACKLLKCVQLREVKEIRNVHDTMK